MRKILSIILILACLSPVTQALQWSGQGISQAQAAVVVLGSRGTRVDWAGLSTDTKPTSGGYGSTFYATDTLTLYVYTAQGWVEDRRPSPPKS